jgi:2-keto-4-pentenoate hydratase/2-oxohepta-3-ene-1,7-dioic acid hydratase in catechol pathway
MKLGRILREGPDGPQPRLVAVDIEGGAAVDLRDAERRRLQRSGATAEGALRIAAALFPGSLTAALGAGPVFFDWAATASTETGDEASLPLAGLTWAPAVDPPVMLDYAAFEQHLVNAHARAKNTVHDVFYERPIYYKMDPATLIAHEDVVRWPPDSSFMDYELELGIVIGSGGSDLHPDDALNHVLGVTVLNDFTARDVQAHEMPSGFGPAKGKDFATALGPWVTTRDELDLNDLTMLARVNGEEWSRGSTSSMTWSVAELVAYASRGGAIVPGEVIGSGTVGLGCGLELYRKLAPGDVIELEIGGVGTLRNTIGEPSAPTWRPTPKPRTAAVTLPPRPG